MRNDHKFTNALGVMIQRGFNKKYTPNLWEAACRFLWQSNTLGHTGTELRGWELSEKDAEGLRFLGLSWEEAKKRRSWAECKQEYWDPCVLIMCCLRLRGSESKRCGNVFTYQEPAWSWGYWHCWTSSGGRHWHRDANNLRECWKKCHLVTLLSRVC